MLPWFQLAQENLLRLYVRIISPMMKPIDEQFKGQVERLHTAW
jgi:hypothetical protein